MTGRHAAASSARSAAASSAAPGPARARPDVHLPSVLGRLRADVGVLVPTAVVLAVTAFLAGVTPAVVARVGDAAVRDAVADAGRGADLVVTVPLAEEPTPLRELHPESATTVIGNAGVVESRLPPELADVLEPPLATVMTSRLEVVRPADGGPTWTFRLAYLWRDGEPAVTWLAGGPPGAAVSADDLTADERPRPWPVEVGLAEPVAQTLGLGVGDTLAVRDENRSPVEVTVSGVFRPDDAADPVWSRAAEVLDVQRRGGGPTGEVATAGLLSADALPAARLAVGPQRTTQVFSLAPRPSTLGLADVDPIAEALLAVQATPTPLTPGGLRPAITAGLGDELLAARDEVRATRSQASVLLASVVTAAALTLVLAARLLGHRRRGVLAQRRARGGTLPGVAVELGLESVLVAAVGTAAGLLAARAVVGDAVAWRWTVPAAVVALVAAPAFGVAASAAATTGRRLAVERHEVGRHERLRRTRRLALDAAAVLAAAGALAALRARDLVASGPDALLAFAPALGAVAGALLLARLAEPATRAALARARRSRRLVPVLAAARARSAARDALPVVVLATAAALVTVTLAVGATVRDGQEAGSWDAVGGDVAVSAPAGPAVAELAERLAGQDGVATALTARVADGVQLRGPGYGRRVRVVAVDAAAFAALTQSTPLADVAAERLVAGGDEGAGAAGGSVPVLLSPALAALGERDLSVAWEGGGRVGLDVVGSTPPLGAELTAVVDAGALAAAGGDAVEPDTVWVVGPGADAAVTAAGLPAEADVVRRVDWLADRRAAPLTGALATAVVVTALVLLALAVTAVVLGAAASAPDRAATLARLRTLGLTGAEVRRISLGELAPPTLLASLGGVGIGAVVAGLSVAPLGLRLVTGGSATPALVVPAWVLATAAGAAATVVVVVLVEQSLRRRERLGQVLRVG